MVSVLFKCLCMAAIHLGIPQQHDSHKHCVSLPLRRNVPKNSWWLQVFLLFGPACFPLQRKDTAAPQVHCRSCPKCTSSLCVHQTPSRCCNEIWRTSISLASIAMKSLCYLGQIDLSRFSIISSAGEIQENRGYTFLPSLSCLPALLRSLRQWLPLPAWFPCHLADAHLTMMVTLVIPSHPSAATVEENHRYNTWLCCRHEWFLLTYPSTRGPRCPVNMHCGAFPSKLRHGSRKDSPQQLTQP